jgi:LuxR family maltose regulon positive regulatory protein
MQGREDVTGFVESFSGSNRHVFDFLAEEVLGRQPEDVRAFLLRTSVLKRMRAPLCAALTGSDDAQEMLERLERDNLFAVPLDDARRWYRYHHLFAEFLRTRLGRESPELVGELNLSASAWFEANGFVTEAITHALFASSSDPDYERAARLIEREAKHAWGSGEGATVLAWLEALPVGAKRHRPRLLLEHALALALTGRPDAAEPLLEEAEGVAETAGEDRHYLLGFASAIRCYCACLKGEGPQAVAFGRRALSLLPDEESPHRNFAAICLGEALRLVGDLAAAGDAFAEAVRLGRATGHVYGMLTGMVWQARVQAEQGRLREADDALRRALRFVTERGVELLPAVGLAYIGMGVLLYEQNDLEGAERELQRGLELAERTREVSTLVRGYITLSRVKQAKGDGEGALVLAGKAERVARTSGADLEIAIATAWTVRLHIARGDLAKAGVFERERAGNADPATDVPWIADQVLTRLFLARGGHNEALQMLEKLRVASEEAGRTGHLIEILALQALALWAGNKKEQAVSVLTRALALAEPEGYVRTFIDEGEMMREVLSAVLEARQRGRHDAARHVSARYLAKLLAALAPEIAAPTPNERLPEPLSERELEVLALIAAGASNKEIARKLLLSVSTVKTHINNLYGKLEARSRTQALARARELDLL